MDEQSCLNLKYSEGATLVSFRDASILDATTTQKVGKELYDLVEGGVHHKVVLDFDNVRFLSSQTLGVLLTLRRKADKANVKVVLSRIRTELLRVFEITNLDKLFAFFDNIEDAVAHLNNNDT